MNYWSEWNTLNKKLPFEESMSKEINSRWKAGPRLEKDIFVDL
jgi:hypothetical protein